MGASMYPYNDYYYRPVVVPRRIIYINPNSQVYFTQPGTLQPMAPGLQPVNLPPNVIINQNPNMPNINNIQQPMPFPVQMKKQKKTIPNLHELFDEVKLTQSMLDKGEQKKCSICLEDFEVGTKIIYLPCFHYYHSECIENWTKNSDKCPLCNLPIKIQ